MNRNRAAALRHFRYKLYSQVGTVLTEIPKHFQVGMLIRIGTLIFGSVSKANLLKID